MALGDFVSFEEFRADISNIHDLDADAINVALITSTTNPTPGDSSPTLASYTEVTAGGNYTAGGQSMAATYTEAAGTATFGGSTVSWLQNAGNPTNARWGLVINTTQGNAAIGYIDLDGDFDMSNGDLAINFPSGCFTLA